MSEQNPATEGLARHARERSAEVRSRIEKAIKELRRNKAAINVNAVARTAGVTRKTIYRHEDLLKRIRAHNRLHPTTISLDQAQDHTQETSIVAALRRQLTTQQTKHHTQIADLQAKLKEKDTALAAAHGEIHRLTMQLRRDLP